MGAFMPAQPRTRTRALDACVMHWDGSRVCRTVEHQVKAPPWNLNVAVVLESCNHARFANKTDAVCFTDVTAAPMSASGVAVRVSRSTGSTGMAMHVRCT